MQILKDLIGVLGFDVTVRDIRQGVFHSGVLTRYCGLAATLPRDALRQDGPLVKEPGALLEKTAFELAQMAYSRSILEAAIGMAAINSLLEVDEERCLELNAADLIMRKGENKRVAIVGHFPFVDRVRRVTKELWVIEKNPQAKDLSATEAGNFIPKADVAAITGSSFTNHSFEALIGLCAPGTYVIVLGDTTPLSRILFEYGVDAVCGTRVADPALALRCVSEGANFRQIKGTRRLTLLKE